MADVVVVGAGIVGASLTYHAARLGASVAVVDAGRPGCAVTGCSFGWIGASGVPPGPAAALRRATTDGYRRLGAELPDVDVRWTGSLCWSDGPAPVTALDHDQHIVGSTAIAGLEPDLLHPPPWALHTAGDGAVDAREVTEALLRGARRHGARVLTGTSVHSLDRPAGRVVGVSTSTGDVLRAGTVVLAAGTRTRPLCASVGVEVPVVPSPAILLRLTAPGAAVGGVLSDSRTDLRQDPDGTLLVALGHQGPVTRPRLARRVREAVRELGSAFRWGADVRPRGARLGWRPVPVDGEPVVGRPHGVEGLYLAVMHSGVTFAPVVGRLAAQELVTGADAVELAGCRPTRFPAGPARGGARPGTG